MLKEQTNFGNKMTKIASEMDELLGMKKLEMESLTNQLFAKPDIGGTQILFRDLPKLSNIGKMFKSSC